MADEIEGRHDRVVAPRRWWRVGLRLVDPGNIVRATDTNAIVVVPQLQPISVVFTIPEDSLPAVLAKLAHGVRMPAEAYDREQRRKLSVGSLLTVDNQIDPITGTVKLNPPGADRASRGPAPRLSNRALQRSRPSSNSTSRRRLR
jgi:membrane fusion protein, multidrug efflux system